MSMVTQLEGTIKKAMEEGKHPKCIKMSSMSRSILAEALIRNDPERKHRIMVNYGGIPHVYNEFKKAFEQQVPAYFQVEDTAKKIRVKVRIEVSPWLQDDEYRMEFDNEPFEKIVPKETEQEEMERVHEMLTQEAWAKSQAENDRKANKVRENTVIPMSEAGINEPIVE